MALLPLLSLLVAATFSWASASTSGPFPPSTPTSRAAALQACQRITSDLGSSIVQSSGAAYQFAVNNAWNIQNALFTPTCIVFPRNASHVQTAMREIHSAKSHYGVQAGSHSAMKGWNTVQDGVLIIFSNMQNVSYNATKDSITFEPGVHWGNATAQMSPFGVAPVGGRIGDVGTGLLLGGGISFLSPGQGYAADNFIAVDVVLVDGTLVTATATNKYSDLFKALKGGANRFGIATRYEVRAVHVGTPQETPFFGGRLVFNASAAVALAKATAKYVREVNDPNAALLTTVTTALVDGVPETTCLAVMFYRGTSLPTSIFGDFLAIPAVETLLGPQSWTNILPLTDPPFISSARGFVQHFGASALVGQENLFVNALTHFTNFSRTFMDPASGAGMNTTTLQLTPVTVSQIAAGHAKGGNSIISPGQNTPFAMIQLIEQWNAGVQDIPPFVQQGMDLYLKQVPRSAGLSLFINECDASQEVYATYGEYEFLKATYKKYDPERFNVQHIQGPIGL
ncbi:hypothetical protein C8F01DRAFT_560532 [Mycena amicta]|nr:hypothetical protein C8F01DRAFT_560532 [Mycena amicta]